VCSYENQAVTLDSCVFIPGNPDLTLVKLVRMSSTVFYSFETDYANSSVITAFSSTNYGTLGKLGYDSNYLFSPYTFYDVDVSPKS